MPVLRYLYWCDDLVTEAHRPLAAIMAHPAGRRYVCWASRDLHNRRFPPDSAIPRGLSSMVIATYLDDMVEGADEVYTDPRYNLLDGEPFAPNWPDTVVWVGAHITDTGRPYGYFAYGLPEIDPEKP